MLTLYRLVTLNTFAAALYAGKLDEI